MNGKIDIFGVGIDDVDQSEALSRILEFVRERTPRQVCTPNVDHIVMMRRDPEFRRVVDEAALVVPDGMPIVWMSRWNGTPLKERVTGSDLLPELCALAAQHGHSVYFLGAEAGVAEEVARRMTAANPGLRVAGFSSPPRGFDGNPEAEQAEIAKVRAAAPDLLFVALGSPKQEKWIHRNLAALNVPVAIGVGAAFNFVAGLEKRPPKWFQDHGLEWFVRFLQHPRLRAKRTLQRAPLFVMMLLDLRTYSVQKRLLRLGVFLFKALGDAALVGLTYFICHQLRFRSGLFDWINNLFGRDLFPAAPWRTQDFITLFVYLMVLTVIAFMSLRLYDPHLHYRFRDLLSRVARGWTFALLVLLSLAFFGGDEMRLNLVNYARSTLVLTWAIGVVLLGSWRSGVEWFRRDLRRRGRFVDRILVVGAGEAGRRFVQRLAENPDWGVRAVGFLDGDPARLGQTLDGVPVIGTLKDFFAASRSRKVDLGIVAAPDLTEEDLRLLYRDSRRAGVGLGLIPTALALFGQRTVPAVVGGLPVLRIVR